jgi:hypothetical protein
MTKHTLGLPGQQAFIPIYELHALLILNPGSKTTKIAFCQIEK